MRSTSRLLATVKSATKYLEPNTPTGLTGLTTHPAPRQALIYTYRKTLSKLTQLPQSSVYRQSTEALTKHRLKIVEETVPEGFDAWVQRVKKQIEASPRAYNKLINEDGSFSYEALGVEKPVPWDGEVTKQSAISEGSNTMSEAERKATAMQAEEDALNIAEKEGVLPTPDDLEREPALTSEQISSIETKIGAGLIEEVVVVAEGELQLVAAMLRHRPWEELEEQSPSGQWQYFERGDRI